MEASTAEGNQLNRNGSTSWVSKLPLGAAGIAIASTILIAFKLLSIAQFNPEIAYAILQANGTGTVIVGTVISLLPGIAIIAATSLALTLIFLRSSDLNPAAEFVVSASTVTLTLVIALSVPIRYLYNVAICVVLVLVVWIFREAIRANRRAGRLVARALAVIFAITLIQGIILSPPWMPEEHLFFGNHSPVTGYILAQTTYGVTVLEYNPRIILYYPPGALQFQAICLPRATVLNDFPILYYIPHFPSFRHAHYHTC